MFFVFEDLRVKFLKRFHWIKKIVKELIIYVIKALIVVCLLKIILFYLKKIISVF